MTEEYRTILHDIETADMTDKTTRIRIREMWTAYCRRENLQVDSFQYDTELVALWMLCEDNTGEMTIEDFNRFMGELL